MRNLCINARCPKPENDETQLFCQGCGSELLLGGRYRVIAEIGSGGFGKTYEVSATHQTEPMLLKVLINPQEKAIELFQREAQVLSQLDDVGIPKVPEDGYFTYFLRDAQEPLHCLVMEKIEGMDLSGYMKHRDKRPIEVSVAMLWLKEIVTILKTVHNQQFFHRDIKPANIMLRSSGALALIDFGTVRQISATYVSKQGMGQVTGVVSAGYTAPEQLNGQAVLQSDFFALGRTLVFLLTGQEPADLYDAYQDAVVWRTIAPEVPPAFAELVDGLMARAIRDRPQSAQEILDRLAVITPTQTVTPQPPSSGVAPTEVVPQALISTPPPPPPHTGQPNIPSGVEPTSVQPISPTHSTPVSAQFPPPAVAPASPLEMNQTDLIKWVFANLAGYALSGLLTTEDLGTGPLLLAIGGAMVGGGQWLVLQQKIQKSWRWPLATAACYGVPIGVWWVLFPLFVLPCIQSWIFRPYFNKSNWWIAISIVSTMIAFVLSFMLVGLKMIDSTDEVLLTAIFGAIYGVATSVGLRWMIQDSTSQVQVNESA